MQRETHTIMCMPVRLEVVDAVATEEAYEEVFAYLTEVDERFSTYKETSEVSRVNRAEIASEDYSPELQDVLARSVQTKEETNGYFDVYRPDGMLDPSGLVKGLAIHQAANLLRKRGYENFYLEIAGDIETVGAPMGQTAWSIGIKNPFASEELIKVVYLREGGIATSGLYERGAHLYNPHVPEDTLGALASITVVGPNVYEADRFATAAFVMGTEGVLFIESHPELEAYAVLPDHTALMTSGFHRYTSS